MRDIALVFIFYSIFKLPTVLSKSSKLLNTFPWLDFFIQHQSTF